MTTLWTVGHSTRTLDEFLDLLRAHGVQVLVDIRRYPASRRNPHFATVPLKKSLHGAGIRYAYLGDELGGWRKTRPDSRHVGLRNASFRGYADWMEGDAFRRGLERLGALAGEARACVMCAERPVSNCHRRLLADHVALVEGWTVVDLYDADKAVDHAATPGARRDGDHVVYEVPASSPLEAFGDEAE